MRVIETAIPGPLLIEPEVFGDARGYFMELYRANRYAELGIPPLVQDNLSYSRFGVLRGLHLQHPHAQGKLVQVLSGEVFDVAVDVRRGSPHFGRWVGIRLSGDNKRQFWIPPGFAHGFLVTSEHALLMYKNTEYYHPQTELSLRWNDPELAITWPLQEMVPELSAKDREGFYLRQIPAERLPALEDYL
ncbi:dTDP-4-dehydrorhamnose 3,5-epimerase [Caldichromatium japonicum]|uniref:dTDP-4-dehydrorhamnose 3,5-epimerase n=1 Tax=Caldichromatium japonicum TaxID=2699430 RepID=A0A6G7VF55_9GAMM|nr:dTDP-4-dehydrorhamnose 3,5-epimerase [Caldichromatium japonicum]QIK38651.1 dTDP-4-dehydrorhamnose 3,5-epimerase [Caldichromatium japonicum]